MTEEVYIKAIANYGIICTKQKKHITYLTFSCMEEQLSAEFIMLIHKSCLPAISAIQTIDGNEVIISSMRLPPSKN